MVEEGQDAFLGTLVSQTSGDTWQVNVRLNNTPVTFQIDTGSEVTLIPTSMHSKLNGANLRPSQRTLRGPSQCALPVLGQFTINLAMGNCETHQDVYVLDNMHTPLLGRPAFGALGFGYLSVSDLLSRKGVQSSISRNSLRGWERWKDIILYS